MSATVQRDLRWYLRKIREKGVRGVYRHFLLRVPHWEDEWIDRYYDRKYGIRTGGEIPAHELGHTHPEWHDYGPSYYRSFRRIMRKVDLDAGRDVFVDYGSGLGRVLVCAAMYPVRKVIGVEFSAQLNEAARRNVETARPWMRCDDVEIVAADAALYELPDDATLLYFANPFKGSILRAVLARIEASLQRRPRRIQLVSHSHEAHTPFEQEVRRCEWLRMTAEVRLLRGYRAWIYTNSRWTHG